MPAGAQFDLALNTQEAADGSLSGFVSYAAELFEARTIARLARHFVRLLEGICADPSQPIGLLPLLEEDEQAQLATWNDTAKDYGPQVNLSERISQQAARTPQAPALVFGDAALSYAELEARINQLANRLRSLGVQRGSLVGISLERSLELVIGLHAIVRAGGAYVPLDPEYPLERLAYLLEDSGVDLLLSHSALVERLPLPVRAQGPGPGSRRLQCRAGHTTGSQPAGQRSGLRHLHLRLHRQAQGRPATATRPWPTEFLWMQEAYQLGAGECGAGENPVQSSTSRYGSSSGRWSPAPAWPLPRRATTVIRRSWWSLSSATRSVRCTSYRPCCRPSSCIRMSSNCQSLTRVICSGEALPAELQVRTFQRLPQAGLYNLYGPTVAAIECAASHWTCVEEGRTLCQSAGRSPTCACISLMPSSTRCRRACPASCISPA